MSDIAQFIAVPIDRTDQGLVAGEAFKCASPQAAIERARGYWKVFGHAGAVAFVRSGYPDGPRRCSGGSAACRRIWRSDAGFRGPGGRCASDWDRMRRTR